MYKRVRAHVQIRTHKKVQNNASCDLRERLRSWYVRGSVDEGRRIQVTANRMEMWRAIVDDGPQSA